MCGEWNKKTEGIRNQLDETTGGEKRVRSATNALIRTLDQVIYANMDVDDYIGNYNDSEPKRHISGNKNA